jgi:FtsZ-binding cell division protein ZapB
MWDRAKPREQFVRLTVAGAAQADLGRALGKKCKGRFGLLLPVELRHVNHTASTNKIILGVKPPVPLKWQAMSYHPILDQVAERVERLLLRHEELQRTNALLSEQVEALTQERNSLKSRLSAARARVDALLERLPETLPEKDAP